MTVPTAKRVAVIGAGISGLVAAKVLRADGFDVVIYEKAEAVGGVWSVERAYPGLRANNPRETYAYSDHPYPDTADEYPTAEQVREYLRSYISRFELAPIIHLNHEVAHVEQNPDNSFTVDVRTGDAVESHLFDFVVICNGVFSEPMMLDIPGRPGFHGTVFHSSELAHSPDIVGKRVVVVGAGKSALDVAGWVTRSSGSCTLLFRKPYWMAPRFFFGRVRVDALLLTRFAESFYRYYRRSGAEKFLHGIGAPLVRLWWRMTSGLVRHALKMPAEMVPDWPMPSGVESLGVDEEIYEMVNQGRLAVKRAEVSAFTRTGLELNSGERIDAEVVIFATGWRQSTPFLSPRLRRMTFKDGRFQLYRFVLPPRVPGLGFIGYASSLSCQLTAEISAHWLSQCYRGELSLPKPLEMEQEIRAVDDWLAEVMPARASGYYIGPYIAHYLDDLLKDMGLPTKRRRGLAEYFGAFWPNRFATIGEERRQLRAGSQTGYSGAA